jgi:hypothetical protein
MTMPTAQAETNATANQNSASSDDQLDKDIKALEDKAGNADGKTTLANRVTIGLLIVYAAWSLLIALSSLWVVRSGNTQRAVDSQLNNLKMAKVRADAERQLQTESTRIETEAQKRETQIKADADVKIEEAKKDAGEANKEAGRANERAGELELSAQQLAKENLELRSGVANLEKEAADSKRAYLELQERTKPRGLSDISLGKLREYLALVPRDKKMRVEIVRARHKFPITEHSEVYAEQLFTVIKEAGFNVSIVEVPDSEVPRTELFLNAYFGFKENTGAPSRSESLVDAINGTLGEAGLVVQTPRFEPDVRYKDEELVKIIIGLEP